MWEPFHLHEQVKRRSSTQAIPWWWLTSILVLFLKHVIHKLNNMKWPSCLAHLLNRWEVLVLNLRLSSVTFACSPCINVTMYMCYEFLNDILLAIDSGNFGHLLILFFVNFPIGSEWDDNTWRIGRSNSKCLNATFKLCWAKVTPYQPLWKDITHNSSYGRNISSNRAQMELTDSTPRHLKFTLKT